jgi:hypothetical protein
MTVSATNVVVIRIPMSTWKYPPKSMLGSSCVAYLISVFRYLKLNPR